MLVRSFEYVRGGHNYCNCRTERAGYFGLFPLPAAAGFLGSTCSFTASNPLEHRHTLSLESVESARCMREDQIKDGTSKASWFLFLPLLLLLLFAGHWLLIAAAAAVCLVPSCSVGQNTKRIEKVVSFALLLAWHGMRARVGETHPSYEQARAVRGASFPSCLLLACFTSGVCDFLRNLLQQAVHPSILHTAVRVSIYLHRVRGTDKQIMFAH